MIDKIIKNKRILKTFIKNFLIAGITLGLYSVIIELTSPEFVGFIHGALPITFTYLIFLVYFTQREKITNMALFSGISGLLWVGFVLLLYLLLKNGVDLPLSYTITFIIFIIACYIFWKINKKHLVES